MIFAQLRFNWGWSILNDSLELIIRSWRIDGLGYRRGGWFFFYWIGSFFVTLWDLWETRPYQLIFICPNLPLRRLTGKTSCMCFVLVKATGSAISSRGCCLTALTWIGLWPSTLAWTDRFRSHLLNLATIMIRRLTSMHAILQIIKVYFSDWFVLEFFI